TSRRRSGAAARRAARHGSEPLVLRAESPRGRTRQGRLRTVTGCAAAPAVRIGISRGHDLAYLSHMEIRLLGSLEVIDDSGQRVPLRGVRLQALVAALALSPGNAVSVDRLVDALWGDTPPEGAANALQRHVSTLRKLLGNDTVERRGTGYVLADEN